MRRAEVAKNGVYVKRIGERAGACGIARDENGGLKRKGGERGELAYLP
jgi:hypothetical protein